MKYASVKRNNLRIPMTVINFIFLMCFTLFLNASDMVIVPEKTDYKQTSTYKDVMDLVFEAQTRSDNIRVVKMTTSTEDLMIPLVIVSSEGIKYPREAVLSGKPVILIMANIHAGEVEGKEAILMLLRDVVNHKLDECLKNQIILFLPIFNPDGNDKMGANRGDNGPELAGVRYNGQYLDLNRDYMKMESPEVSGLVGLLNQWDPLLVVDMHTTDGSLHRIPVTYSTLTTPNADSNLTDYMWKEFFPAVSKTLKSSYGYDSIPYGDFQDDLNPQLGWVNEVFDARFGSNYVGLRNRFSVLDENYSHADFKTRVLSSYAFIRSILDYTRLHANEMAAKVKEADLKTLNGYFKGKFHLENKAEKLSDVTIKSYEFKVEKMSPEEKAKYPPSYPDLIPVKTDVFKDYTVPYFAKAVPTRSLVLPEAYVIPPYHKELVKILKKHGIIVERISKPVKMNVETFKIKELTMSKMIYQGHIPLTIKGEYTTQEKTIPQNSYLVSLKQPLSRLIPVLLEPESSDSLASWGFISRELVEQWTGRFKTYPIFRIQQLTVPIERYQD